MRLRVGAAAIPLLMVGAVLWLFAPVSAPTVRSDRQLLRHDGLSLGTSAVGAGGSGTEALPADDCAAITPDYLPETVNPNVLRVRVVGTRGEPPRGRIYWKHGPRFLDIVRKVALSSDWSQVELDGAGRASLTCPCEHFVWLAAVVDSPSILVYHKLAPGDRSALTLKADESRGALHVVVWNEDLTTTATSEQVVVYRRSIGDTDLRLAGRMHVDADGYARFGELQKGHLLACIASADPHIPGADVAPVTTERPAGNADELLFLCGARTRVHLRLRLAEVPAGSSLPPMVVLRDLDRQIAPVLLGEARGREWQVERLVPASRYRLECRPEGLYEFEGFEAVIDARRDLDLTGRIVTAHRSTRIRLRGLQAQNLPYRLCIERANQAVGMEGNEDYAGGVNLGGVELQLALHPGRQRFVVFDREGVRLSRWCEVPGGEASIDAHLADGSMLDCSVAGDAASHLDYMAVCVEDCGSGVRIVEARRSMVEVAGTLMPGFHVSIPVTRGNVLVQCMRRDASIVAVRTTAVSRPFHRLEIQ